VAGTLSQLTLGEEAGLLLAEEQGVEVVLDMVCTGW
jgi:hypothetical protein